MPESSDYTSLGLVCGIEIHQQLDTAAKLFCGCPTRIRDSEEHDHQFFRHLRPARSELGEIDRAALEEVLVSRKFIYRSYDTTCLVEADDEPPSELNPEALEIGLVVSRLLNMQIADEVHTMRKIVIDGSNTSGFQRTAYLASHGGIETSRGRVGIETICLEEEAARIVDDRGDEVIYSLDRLGIPLVEICTSPDIISPSHAREVAQRLGMILRSTGRVKRGLGTIRQDVNVSIRGGARVEIKGVQELNLIETIVAVEAERQKLLLKISGELLARGAIVHRRVAEVTGIFAGTGSKVIESALRKGGVVLAVRLEGFSGLLAREIQPGRRLGSELSDRAKRAGVGGIFHSDELPAYGITQKEVEAVRSELGAGEGDSVVMVAAPRDRAEAAMKAVLERGEEALAGVPEETRRALPDGTSEYMRPLPGSARMYPETDVPPVVVTSDYVNSLKLPELFDERAARFSDEYGLNREFAGLIASSPNYQLFEKFAMKLSTGSLAEEAERPRSFVEDAKRDILAEEAERIRGFPDAVRDLSLPPALVVRTLEMIPRELARDGIPISSLTEDRYLDALSLIAGGRVAKEGVPQLLETMANRPELSAAQAAEAAGLAGVGEGDVEAVVARIVADKEEFIRERGEAAMGPLMGLVMKELRGKADGALVSSALRREIDRILAQ
ncbi:Glu-tRNA(Gln) amidotransferase subunit GatE [Candidatus Methanocrinis natronophilus]|uniref:Glutamyl-tRNA(Gln) amidotransferase subunit E n=1 Tax=Candidatus Methanocrinis natronophilus TaxID=3033396 RepID=A0ABT5X6Z5_9EURY|nr:Glu-tRNA(Gln) amidotransferase subunit GatE [Candidatus Methanocrinis natronophilus]MDF0590476.1 Glu-tRNA(Gln) amidotransferase subunit GatE [Candidatus Methanocrinis natronophilus]